MQKMNQSRSEENSQSGNNSNGEHQMEMNHATTHTKFVRIEFPYFNGEDPASWLYKVNNFFLYYNTPSHQRLLLASFHMEGKALIWFHDLEESGMLLDWNAFVKTLLSRFGSSCYDDPMEALTRLRQTDSMEDYKAKFKALLNRLAC